MSRERCPDLIGVDAARWESQTRPVSVLVYGCWRIVTTSSRRQHAFARPRPDFLGQYALARKGGQHGVTSCVSFYSRLRSHFCCNPPRLASISAITVGGTFRTIRLTVAMTHVLTCGPNMRSPSLRRAKATAISTK